MRILYIDEIQMNKIKNIFLSLLVLLPINLIFAQQNTVHENALIGPAAVWRPSMQDMQAVTAKCGNLSGSALNDCFISVMRSSGASVQAISFAELMKGDAYMRSFKDFGIVGCASVYYPLRSDEHDGLILVNGNPELINVDNFDLLPLDTLYGSPEFERLKSQFSHLALYPGDRLGTDYPLKEDLPHHGERLVVNYDLRDGCRTCPLAGYAYFSFDFDSTGDYTGSKLIKLTPAAVTRISNNTARAIADVFSDPSKPVIVNAGKEFSIVLVSNHSEGNRWELLSNSDKSIVTLMGSTYITPYEHLPNSAGKEIWTFKALGEGSSELTFKYIASWHGDNSPIHEYKFNITVQ